VWVAAWAALALSTGCLPESSAVPCGDLVCAAPQVCAPLGGACVSSEQVDACEGKADGAGCELVGVGAGLCRDRVCVVAGCGDGVLDAGEACDDGNDDDTDACTSACALPDCGDEVLQGEEECDDGAANADDRACTTRCLVATCGDGLVHAGVEGCDAGTANADDGACTLACQPATCGDGVVFAGVEACDDDNTDSGDGCRADCRKVEVCGDAELDAGEACDDGNGNTVDGCDACVATTWVAEASLGGASAGASIGLFNPHGVAVDVHGRLFLADTDNFQVRRLDPDGTVTTIAGTSGYGDWANGAQATSAFVFGPSDVAVDGLGRVFIAEIYSNQVRRVDRDGTIWTIAGVGGQAGFGGDGGPATSAHLSAPTGVAVDGLGRVYIADRDNHRVRRIDETGVITTIAGTGAPASTGDGGLATDAALNAPWDVALDDDGRLLVTENSGNRVRRIDGAGVITTFAGTGAYGFAGDDGPATSAPLAEPTAVTVDGDGRVLVTTAGQVRRIDTDGMISTPIDGLFGPRGVVVEPTGTLITVEAWHGLVRRFDEDGGGLGDGAIILGNRAQGFQGDGGAATAARLQFPMQIAVDGDGRVYVADYYHHRVRRLESDGTITSVAGSGTIGNGGDGGPAIAAELAYPIDLAFDAAGRLLIADQGNCAVRRVDLDGDGTIVTIAGRIGLGCGGGGDGGPAVNASLAAPSGLAVGADGTVYIADTDNHRIRAVDDDGDGVITTVVGTGTAGALGDGGPALAAQLKRPNDIAFDGLGRLLIADASNHKVRRAVLGGNITTIAGTGTQGYSGDGGPATAATLAFPWSVFADQDGGVLVADPDNHRLRRIAPGGTISTVVGTGVQGSNGDAGPALAAQLNFPAGVLELADRSLLISENGGGRIRRVSPDGQLSTIIGWLDPPGVGPLAQASLATPRGLARTDDFDLIAGGVSGVVEAIRPDVGWLDAVIGRYPHTVASGALARLRAESFGDVGDVAWDAAAGRIYLTEVGANRVHVVDVVDPADAYTWTIAVLAGTSGEPGYVDGAAAVARFRQPTGLDFDAASRTLLVADGGNHVIRSIDVDTGEVSTIAGTPATRGYFGDGLTADAALLYAPQAMTRCPSGDLYIRRVEADTGLITTVLGDGVAASSGEGAPASTFPVDAPLGLACDAAGNVYATSSTTVRLLPADAAGLVDGTGPVQSIYGAPPRDTFPATVTTCLTDVAVVDAATLRIIDGCVGLLVDLRNEPS
jgi:cysteine-rich repeat protein